MLSGLNMVAFFSQTIRFRRAVCAIAAAAALAACSASSSPDPGDGFPEAPYATLTTDGGLRVELRTAPEQPPVRGEARAELRVADAEGRPRDGLSIEVTPWMPAHGHGSPKTPVVTALGDGAYRVDAIELTMAGTWELRISLGGAEGASDRATARLEVR